MRQLFETVKQQLTESRDVILVTVIASSGSTPRGSGAHMVVTKAGRIYGTIGGGAVEYRSTQMAADALKNKSSVIHEFYLTRNEVEDLGMICGGNVTVYFRYISHKDKSFITFIDNLLKLIEQGETSWLLMGLSEENQGDMGVYGMKSGMFGIDVLEFDDRTLIHQTQHIQINGRDYYAEELLHSGNPAYYLGLIGSARKIAAISEILREHGFSEERIAGIHTPIGLSIKAETPAEIAVSITAQLILERAERLEVKKGDYI